MDAQPVPRSRAVRGGRRPRLPRSRRGDRGDGRRARAGTSVGRLRSIRHRQVVGGQGRARPRASTRGDRWLGVLAHHRHDAWQRSVRAAPHGAGPCRRRRLARRRGRAELVRPLARRARSWRRAARHERRHRDRPVRGAVHPYGRRGRTPGVRADARGHDRATRGRRADRRHGARRLPRSAPRLRRVRGRHEGAGDRPRCDVGGRDGRGDPPARGRRRRRRRTGPRRPDHR